MQYTDFPDFPEKGTILCANSDIRAGGAHVAMLREFPYLVVQSADGPRAYVNVCPHQFLPLDYRSPQIIGTDGSLLCSNHSATFDALSGAGTGGLGLGCQLTAIPIRAAGENWVVA